MTPRRTPAPLALALALALAVASPRAGAQPVAQAPILAPPSLPGLTAENRALYARWIGFNLGRAIAFGPNGAQGAAWNVRDIEAAKATALQN